MNLVGRGEMEGRMNATMFGSVSLSYHNNGSNAIKVLMHHHIPRARDTRQDKLRIIEVTDRGKIKEYFTACAKSVKLALKPATGASGSRAHVEVFENIILRECWSDRPVFTD